MGHFVNSEDVYSSTATPATPTLVVC